MHVKRYQLFAERNVSGCAASQICRSQDQVLKSGICKSNRRRVSGGRRLFISAHQRFLILPNSNSKNLVKFFFKTLWFELEGKLDIDGVLSATENSRTADVRTSEKVQKDSNQTAPLHGKFWSSASSCTKLGEHACAQTRV